MRNTQMKNETTVKIAGETERGTALCDALKSARSEQNVKAEFYNAVGIGEAQVKGDTFSGVLFVFRKEKKISAARLSSMLAQALYTVRKIRYEETERMLPERICGVCREEAFLASTQDFSAFCGKRAGNDYDWDRTPASPCPVLTRDLLSSPQLCRVRVYSLGKAGEEKAFRAALAGACGEQLSMFPKEKKPITEENFERVYEYWASLFSFYLDGRRGEKKLAEYFLADALRGGAPNKNGRVEFLL